LIAAEQDRPDVARRRAQWTKYRNLIDPSRLVFIDETWTKTNMEPLRGWAPVGQRIKAKVPHGHWKTMTFLAALRLDRVEAPWLIDGPINGERFQIYVEKVLIPTLRPGDIVVMDNLGSHKAKVVRRADNLHNWIVLDVSGPIVIEARPLELNDCDRSTVISPSTRLSPKNARSAILSFDTASKSGKREAV
jgi:DDE superfamily endonuclease